MRTILLQLHAGNPLKCDSWSYADVAHGTQITVYVDSTGGQPERMGRQCYALLERELAALGAFKRVAPCVEDYGQIFPAYTCAGAVAGLVHRVLIFVADGSGTIEPTILSYFTEPGAVVVPIVDASLGTNPQPSLPPQFRTTLAERTSNFDAAPLLARLIRACGLLSPSRSVFISYRHADAAAIAGQLFHELAARGYAPFLDRFGGQPGDDFVDLVNEELADKACLLSLETQSIGQSLYCHQEVATAVARHMGMVAVDLPGSQPTFPVIAKRIDATGAALSGNGELSRGDLQQIVSTFERHFPHESARRPRRQDYVLHQALLMRGLPFAAEGLGQYSVHSTQEVLLSMSPGFPDAEQFRQIETRRDIRSRSATVFGPLAAARSNRYRLIDWLSSRTRITALDEGELLRYLGNL